MKHDVTVAYVISTVFNFNNILAKSYFIVIQDVIVENNIGFMTRLRNIQAY